MQDYYARLVQAIITSQEELIGEVAWGQAAIVPGLEVANHEISIESPDPEGVLETLVNQYSMIFGPAAVEVCRRAVKQLVNDGATKSLPAILR